MQASESTELGWPMVIVGLFLLTGFVAHVVGRRAHVPRVTLLLMLGLLAGPQLLDVVPHSVARWFPVAAQLALSMVGFSLGEQLSARRLRQTGRGVLTIALWQSLFTAATVGLLLLAAGVPLSAALLLAGIAPATAPAATVDVIRESGARGELTDTVLGVAAVDDAYTIVLFSVMMATVQITQGTSGAVGLLDGAWEVGGSVALGALIGLPMAWLTGRARPGSLTLVETLGFVFISSGLAVALGLSYLLANITVGAMVANFARHHRRPFHAISGVTQPCLIVFFFLAGFELQLEALPGMGVAGGLYLLGRTAGKVVGASVGARLAGVDRRIRRYVGWCLLPQAGVALGLGLLANQRVGPAQFNLLTLLVATTFVFEVVGPIATQVTLRRAGEAAGGRRSPSLPPQ